MGRAYVPAYARAVRGPGAQGSTHRRCQRWNSQRGSMSQRCCRDVHDAAIATGSMAVGVNGVGLSSLAIMATPPLICGRPRALTGCPQGTDGSCWVWQPERNSDPGWRRYHTRGTPNHVDVEGRCVHSLHGRPRETETSPRVGRGHASALTTDHCVTPECAGSDLRTRAHCCE